MKTRTQLGIGIACLAATFAAFAQTWEYKYYKYGPGGQYEKDRFVAGTLSLADEKDGRGTLRVQAGQGRGQNCLRGDMPATVTRTDATTTIEPELLTGCETIRYVIRNDGSGGTREVKREDRWVQDKVDHGLTPVAK